MLKLTGNTYDMKEFIKEAGGFWDKNNNHWVISESDWHAFKNKEGFKKVHNGLIEMNDIKAEVIAAEEIICSGSDRRGNYTVSRVENVEFAPSGKFYKAGNGNYGRYQYFISRDALPKKPISCPEAMDFSDELSEKEFDEIFA